jgi:hypothetical protein
MKPKDEIEKLADNWSDDYENGAHRDISKRSYIAGYTQCQEEIMYSEEEVYELLLKHQSAYRSVVRNTSPLDWSFDIKQWFEQFKKK